jgi:hypothetical protein
LKLLIADVHNKNIMNAKHCFYNAEFIRKIIVSRKILTITELQAIYDLIEGIYNNAFGLMTAGIIKDGNHLVAHIHQEIQSQDQQILQSIKSLNFIHKTGMLHQLSNDLKNDIWWSDGHSPETIEKFKKENIKE